VIAAIALAALIQEQPSLEPVMREAERAGFSGVVLVARRGEVLLHRGYGLANRAAGTPFDRASLVQIGSNVKDFTKVAIYQLVERGLLSPADTLGRFFGDLPAGKSGITVQQLLDHRSGLPHGVSGERGDEEPLTRDEMLARVRAVALAAPPGTREIYSNAGYSLLAAIVETVSGMPFDEYVARNITDPLGLRDIGSHLRNFDRARIAHGYGGGRDYGSVLDQPHDRSGHLYQLRGNGGYVATVGDMYRFYQALRGDALLRDAGHRRAVVDPDRPGVYAGSDMVSFFLYANFPGAGVEILIGSNSREYMGNRLMRELLPALGIRFDGDRPEAATQVTSPLLPRIPDTPVGRTVTAYLEAWATGDTAVMRRFFTEHGGTGPGVPSMETRLSRYLDMRGRLGRLTILGAREGPDGLIVVARAENGDELQMTFNVDPEPPHRLRGIRVEAGQ